MEVNAYVRHGFTPGRTPFADGTRCVVMLARYPCPDGPDEHDPALPPVDIDAFGRRRRNGSASTNANSTRSTR